MKLVLVSSEVEPFAKTGGLADVCGSLPRELRRLGHDVSIFLPAYRSIWRTDATIEFTPIEYTVRIGSRTVEGRLLQSFLPGSDVPIYFVHQPAYFDREHLYASGQEDYPDNCERFVFFCRAVLESLRQLGGPPDLLHCNDWQTGLIPALLRTEPREYLDFAGVRTLLTIHNLAYQGCFGSWGMELTGIDRQHFNWRQMEFYGQLNLLKTGIVFADAISTVSPRYAREIQTKEFGHGLEGVLRARADDLIGILNGIDVVKWNPASDPHLPQSYDVGSWREGKAAAKQAVQTALGLPESPHTPLIGCVGRLVSQKGWDLILQALDRLLTTSDVQWGVLGTGDWEIQQGLEYFRRRHPQRLGVRLEFSEGLAHLIEAGSDLFLMPSRYEPCGLNQMYSLRYGAVPVVFFTGGLADTVVDTHHETLHNLTANGFVFHEYDMESMVDALRRAVQIQQDHPRVWDQIVATGMREDWSWARSARQYELLYRRLLTDE